MDKEVVHVMEELFPGIIPIILSIKREGMKRDCQIEI